MNYENIINLTLGKTVFKYRDTSYRLTGFLFTYRSLDGERRDAFTTKENANALSGSGVAGVIAPIDEVEILDRTTTWDEVLLKQEEESYQFYIDEDKGKYEFLSSLPQGLTEEEIRKLAVKRTMQRFKHK